jgi:hypothetical protein
MAADRLTQGSDRRRRLFRVVVSRGLPNVAVAGLAPVVTYFTLRPHVRRAAIALAVSFAIPVVWAALCAAWRRRVNLTGMLSIGAYGLALIVTVLSGGSPLPLELQRAAETGAVGAACVISVGLRRPLLVPALRCLVRRSGRRSGTSRRGIDNPALRYRLSVATLLVGAICLVDATVQATLALALPPGVFVAASTPARVAVFVGGGAMLVWCARRSTSRRGGRLQGSGGGHPVGRIAG